LRAALRAAEVTARAVAGTVAEMVTATVVRAAERVAPGAALRGVGTRAAELAQAWMGSAHVATMAVAMAMALMVGMAEMAERWGKAARVEARMGQREAAVEGAEIEGKAMEGEVARRACSVAVAAVAVADWVAKAVAATD